MYRQIYLLSNNKPTALPSKQIAYLLEQHLLSKFDRLNNSEFVDMTEIERDEVKTFLEKQSNIYERITFQRSS